MFDRVISEEDLKENISEAHISEYTPLIGVLADEAVSDLEDYILLLKKNGSPDDETIRRLQEDLIHYKAIKRIFDMIKSPDE